MAFSKLLFLCHKQREIIYRIKNPKLYPPKEKKKDRAANAATRPDMCVVMFSGSIKNKAIFGDANSRLQCQNAIYHSKRSAQCKLK